MVSRYCRNFAHSALTIGRDGGGVPQPPHGHGGPILTGMVKDPKAGKPDRATKRASRREKLGQFKLAFTMTRERDPKLVPYMVGAFVIVVAIIEIIAVVVGQVFLYLAPAVILGLLAALMVFSRRAQRSAYAQMEGRPGAALQILKNMRGDWRVAEAVGANSQLDVVHRVLGRPGVILVAEGAPSRSRNLLIAEKRRLVRVVGETPIYDIIIGNAEGEIPLGKLQAYLVKLPRNLLPKQISPIEKRIQALGSPKDRMPKGPVPQKAQRAAQSRMSRRR